MEIIIQQIVPDGTILSNSNAGIDQIPEMENGVTKKKLEKIMLNKYQDIAMFRADLSFAVISQDDRPDFIVSRHGKRFGLDVAAFGDAKRRSAENHFSKVKNRLTEIYDNGSLRKCKGLAFELMFPKELESKNQVPIKDNINASIDEIAIQFSNLSAYDEIDPKAPRRERRLRQRQIAKKTVPHCGHVSGLTSDGNIYWMVTGIMLGERNDFERTCGFSVSLSFRNFLSNEEVLERFNNVISKHDKCESQNIEELVIMAGAPGTYGLIIRHEEILANLFLDSGLRVTPPKYIQRVILVIASQNTINFLYPYPQ